MFFKEKIEYKIIIEIQKFLEKGETPSSRKLALALGLGENSTKTIQRKIKEFENYGFIKKTKTGRISEVTKSGKINFGLEDLQINSVKTFSIPILGDIACGNPIEAIEDINAEKLQISDNFIRGNPKEYFLLRAVGDSMDKEGIENNDLVLIKKQQFANNGDIVVALIDDSTTLKTFEKNNQGMILLKPNSYNTNHSPIVMTENFLILGKYMKNIGKI